MVPDSNKVMMKLGCYEFKVSKASFDKINRVSTYRWEGLPTQSTKSGPLMQYNGPGEATITIEGTIFPQVIRGGLKLLDGMRALAAEGKARPLIQVVGNNGSGRSGMGTLMGSWCIISISEDRSLYMADGTPREIHFTMELKSFDQGRIK